MLAFTTTTAAAVFLLSVTVNLELATAQDSGGLSDQQACLLSCSLAAVTASACDVQNTACICASSVYAANLTQCATNTCDFSASDVQGFLDSGCAGIVSSAAAESRTLSASASGSSASTKSSVSEFASFTLVTGRSESAAASNTGSASTTASGSAPSASETQAGKPNTNTGHAHGFRLGERRTGVAAAALVFCALLV
ncbi:hypothetical protein B0H13DRAFT_685955 [Mycena leptocephala]|nr:hypothetical protein B0H13DRAFT_685955 [Mycena leptocephala]